MQCLYCSKKFEIPKRQGGQNRNSCYECLPDNLDKKTRGVIRSALTTKKSNVYKLDLGCCRCGYNKCATALEWHHLSSDKESNPSNTRVKSWENYLKEINKCILLCSNCHREEHEN